MTLPLARQLFPLPGEETDQVERARRAQKVCEAEHRPAADHEIYDREEQR
ncbi:hypothetical protein ACFVVA_04460 [Kitasatospora sp. NPDC058048]